MALKILIVTEFGESELISSSFIPRIGEQVGIFGSRLPRVISVTNWPDKKMLGEYGIEMEVDVVIAVS